MDEITLELYKYYIGWFLALLVVLWLYRKLSGESQERQVAPVTADFKRFQRGYVAVFLLAQGADWLQGPYVYALYTLYGFSIGEIGALFIMGFGSSLIFGLLVGSMADKFGRKRMSMVFCVTYGISCMTKHFADYNILMFGRLLGGIATSILFSSFEAWMVHEHHEASYPEEWLGLTFSICTSGNGIVAVSAGVVASFVKDAFGPVAPFDASLLCLLVLSVIIATSWNENTGDTSMDMGATVSHAFNRLVNDRKIALLGIIQSFFEGAMYVFVFMWTPALESTSEHEIYHGWIFASFMVCVLIGSSIFGTLLRAGLRVERSAMYMFGVASLALSVPTFVENHTVRLMSFFVFEVCCGMFWPSIGLMRSRYVPEEVRATVMNFFRIPLNLIVVFVLFNIDKLSQTSVFMLCTMCLLPALLCSMALVQITLETPETIAKKNTEEMQELSDQNKADVEKSET